MEQLESDAERAAMKILRELTKRRDGLDVQQRDTVSKHLQDIWGSYPNQVVILSGIIKKHVQQRE